MNSEQERLVGKISYEKPTAVDLGPTAPIVGASCVGGIQLSSGNCYEVGNGATDCYLGNTAGYGCSDGNTAGNYCSVGDAGPDF